MSNYIGWSPVLLADFTAVFYNREKDELIYDLPHDKLPVVYKDRELAEVDILILKMQGYYADVAKLEITEEDGVSHWKLMKYTPEEISLYYKKKR